MARTQVQINRIHADKSARPGKVYVGPSNVFYVGSKLGHLIQESTLLGEVGGTTLRSVINSIGDYSREELIEILISVADKVDQIEFEDYKKEAKCFTIAMATALG